MSTKLNPVTPTASFCVVCERCQNTILFSGKDYFETFTVLCDECTQ